jgi:FMN-dependent NADH-azoreductase
VKLLDIQSSPRGESSDSITLTSFIETCKSASASIVVDTLNVWHEELPEKILILRDAELKQGDPSSALLILRTGSFAASRYFIVTY